MTELVYQGSNGKGLTDSLRVAVKFEKEHKHVIASIRDILNSAENSAVLSMFVESSYIASNGKENIMFIMNEDGFALLAMGFTGAKALNFKIEFINAFNQMKEKLIELSNFNLPQTYSDALRLAADQAEQIERQQLKISEQSEQIGLQKLQAAKDAPLILFSKSVETSKDSCLIGELAKILKQNGIDNMGEKRLFEWLRGKGYLGTKGEYYNIPTQRSMEMKLFEIKKTTIENPNGKIIVRSTSKVTGKGQIYFLNKFRKEQIENDLFNNYN